MHVAYCEVTGLYGSQGPIRASKISFLYDVWKAKDGNRRCHKVTDVMKRNIPMPGQGQTCVLAEHVPCDLKQNTDAVESHTQTYYFEDRNTIRQM